MQEYYLLFILALIWTIFATIQDLRSKEVSNWLNFSFIAFALAYRAFYSISTNNSKFILFGLAGLAIFLVLGYAFYYIKAFAGGDAKLLMSFGTILPYQNTHDLFTLSLGFIFLLFLSGAVYSIIYSFFIISRKSKVFWKEFDKNKKQNKNLLIYSTILLIISLALGYLYPLSFAFSILFLIPWAYIYTRSLDRCMIVLLPPSKLTEGDWLEKPVRIGNKTIKKTVHGLSMKEIQLLKKYNKKVLIKQGIPFVPAFLISLVIMALFFLISKQALPSFFYFLQQFSFS